MKRRTFAIGSVAALSMACGDGFEDTIPFSPPKDPSAGSLAPVEPWGVEERAFVMGQSRPGELSLYRDGLVTRRGPVGPVSIATFADESADTVVAYSPFVASFYAPERTRKERSFLTVLTASSVWRTSFVPHGGVPFVILGDKMFVNEAGPKTRVVSLSTGEELRNDLNTAAVESARSLGDGRAALSHPGGVTLVDEASLAPQCTFPSATLGPANLFGVARLPSGFLFLREGGQPRVTRILKDCSVAMSTSGIPSGIVDGGFSVLIDKSVKTDPWPRIVEEENSTTQLLIVDLNGNPIRTIGLPEGASEVIPARDLSEVSVVSGGPNPMVTVGRTSFPGKVVGAIPDRTILAISSSVGELRSLNTRNPDASVRATFPGYAFAGHMGGTFLLRPPSTKSPYLRVRPETLEVLERIAF